MTKLKERQWVDWRIKCSNSCARRLWTRSSWLVFTWASTSAASRYSRLRSFRSRLSTWLFRCSSLHSITIWGSSIPAYIVCACATFMFLIFMILMIINLKLMPRLVFWAWARWNMRDGSRRTLLIPRNLFNLYLILNIILKS